MKSSLIGIIIAGVIVIGAIGGYFIATDSTKKIANASTITSQSSDSAAVNTSSATKNNESSSNGNNKNNIDSVNNTSNKQVEKNANSISGQSSQVQNVDWKAINASEVMTSSQGSSFLNLIAQANNQANSMQEKLGDGDQTQLNQMAFKSYAAEQKAVDSISKTIGSALNGVENSKFNQLIQNFNKFNYNSVTTLYNQEQGGSIQPMLDGLGAKGYEQNMGYYLAGAYIDNGANPQIPLIYLIAYANCSNNNTGAKFSNTLVQTQNKCDALVNQMNSKDAQSVLSTYNQIYSNWTTQIDTVYNYVETNSDGFINPETLIPTEKIWISFRDQQVALAGQGLTGTNKEIAEKKMAIRMTQLQTYNLMLNLSNSVGVHF